MQSELEDRTVKITAMKQNKGKNDEMRSIEETFGTLTTPMFILYGSQKEKRERKDRRKYLKR